MNKLSILIVIFSVSLALFSFKITQEEWVVPAKYENMKNPTDPSADLETGKELYKKHCKSCHGVEGYGDGPKAEDLEGDLGDFSSAEFHSQSDGAIFYKSYIGKDDMPSFEKKMSENEMWIVINYIKTLAE